jgi:outer membrane protein assembly factor BamB
MTRRLPLALTISAAAAFGAAVLHAQAGGGEWTTGGFDAQRTGWMRTDPRLSVETMQKAGEFGPFKFLWKLKLEHDPDAATTLTEPVLLNQLIGFRGFKSIAFVGTASETVHAIDIDFGTPLWKYHINYTASPPQVLGGPAACPGGLTSSLSRPTPIAPPAGGGGGGGRGARASGGVGEPGRGATTMPRARGGDAPAPAPPAPAPAPPAAPGATVPGSAAAAAGVAPGGLPGGARQGAPAGGGAAGVIGSFVPGTDAAYVVGSDGYLHALNVSNGWDNMTPALFLPANTRALGLMVATGAGGRPVAYAATTHGCGSQPDSVWAMDLGSPQRSVVAFTAGGAGIAGTGGLALGRDGTVYVTTTAGGAALSSSVVALESRTLKLKASATVPKADFNSSPLVFQWKDKDVVAVAGGGTLYLFDSMALQSGPIASVVLASPGSEAAALVSWLDGQGTRWIAVPLSRGVSAFKVGEQNGKTVLQPGWTSRTLDAPLRPIVINGVMFAASSGTRTTPAVLYAVDAASGKDLWNSGRTMTSAARGSLSGGQGNVYVPGADGTLYAFGFEIAK